jgi:hypothetical protein
MSESQIKYESISHKEAKKMLLKFELTTRDRDRSIAIESGYITGYKLPNGKILLIPNISDQEYPGIIFNNADDFKQVSRSGYFNLEDKFLSPWEKEKKYLDSLPESINYFKEVVNMKLDSPMIESYQGLKEGFEKIFGILRSQKINSRNKHQIIISYGICILHYLVVKRNAQWKFEKRYEVYNSYTYPTVILGKEWLDPISLFYSFVKSNNNNFESFATFLEIYPTLH